MQSIWKCGLEHCKVAKDIDIALLRSCRKDWWITMKNVQISQELFFVCAPWARSNGCKSRTRPDSGKCIAEQQVHREVESEESCKQISGPTDRNHI